MDILAARKKAAEQASARNIPGPEAAAPIAPPQPEQEAPPQREQEVSPRPEQEATPAPVEALTGGPVVPQAAASAAPAVEGSGGIPVTSPAASVGDEQETRQQEIELLSFRLGGEQYAVLVADVREVLKVVQPTIVPNTPDYILGVTSLRGTMLPIIDLCKRFGLTPGVNDEKSRIVIVNSADGEAGLLVDRVTGVFRVLPDEIKPAPENIEQGSEFLRGIVRKDERLYILLDLEKAVGV